jgi:hypothetical protein
MKRRDFVQSAIVTAIGLPLIPGTSLSVFQENGVQQWFHFLISATSAKRQSHPLQGRASFETATASLNAYFSKRGYQALSSDFYFYNDQQQCCFYPLKLQHSAAGLCDMLIPVLTRDSGGAWHHVNTITGYQLEALARAARALAEHPVPLQHLLLPASGPSRVPAHIGFGSEKAMVACSTKLKSDIAETNISISVDGQMIFNDTFISRHCLTFAAV